MEQVPRQQSTKEFWEQAVRLVLEQQVTIPEAARRLTMSGRTLERWVGRARQGQLATLGESRRPVTELEAELSRLKRELAEARMERDILKKATAYVAYSLSAESVVPGAGGVSKRLRCVATSASVGTRPGQCAAGSGEPGCSCAHPADLWAGTAPGGIAGQRLHCWGRAYQTTAQEIGPTLSTSPPVYNHHGFDARPAGLGEYLGPNICGHTTE